MKLSSALKFGLLLIILFPCFLLSQQLRAPIHNYTVKDFKVEGQNWSILQDKRGVMYFGTNYGVFEYDGAKWDIITKPNGVYYMAMAMDPTGRIYVGMAGDFGFIAPDNSGKDHFYSIADQLNGSDRNFDFIKRIYVVGDDVFFCNPSKLFKWSGGKLTVYNLGNLSGSFSYVNKTLMWREKEKGLMMLKNGKQELIKGGELFANEKVDAIIPYSQNRLIIITQSQGIFMYDGSVFTPFKTPIDPILKECSVTKVERLKNGDIVMNTEFNGTMILDSSFVLKQHFTKSNGLGDDNVWYSYADKEDNLWLALNSLGISKVDYNTPITHYDESDGINSAVQCALRYNGSLYIGTGKGLLVLPENNPEQSSGFYAVKDLDAVTNDLIATQGSLLAATFKGVYTIDKNKAVKITDGSFHHLFVSQSDPTIVFVAGDEGLCALKKINGKWLVAREFSEIKEGIMKTADLTKKEQGGPEKFQLWLGCLNNGLLKVSFDDVLSKDVKVQHYDTLQGIPPGNNTDIFQVEGRNVFTRNNILFKFNASENKFVADPVLGRKFTSGGSGIISVKKITSDKFCINYIEALASVSRIAICQKDKNGSYILDSVPFLGMDIGIIWQIFPDANGVIWFCGEHGLVRYDSKKIKDYHTGFCALVRKVTISNDSTLFYGNYFEEKNEGRQRYRVSSLNQPEEMKPTLGYEKNSLSFEYAATSYQNESATVYEYFLEGYDKKWSAWKTETKAVYTNLSEGNYKFHVKAKNVYGNESEEGTYEFTILPPWYRTATAYLFYSFMFIGIVYGSIRLNSRRLKASNVLLQKKINDATLEIRKQKDQIEDKNKDITDSIRYAKRLQSAILKPEESISGLFSDGFILFRPKDIVSGDFYWFEKFGDLTLVAAADCTGHGVPGAFMSIIGCNLLSQTVNEHAITKPSVILNAVNKGLAKVLQQRKEEVSVKDGMDIALCAFNLGTMTMEYSGAYNPMWVVRNGALVEYKADKFPVGAFVDSEVRMFTNHEIKVEKGDMVYLFSDGFADQFGGPDGKKFKYKALQKLMILNYTKSGSAQKNIFEKAFEEWMGKLEQVDDVLVIGIKI